MIHALISDIHANLEALEAVLTHIKKQKADATHCLGDVVGYGGDPSACLKLVNEHCQTKLVGNHEYAALGLVDIEAMNDHAQAAMRWTTSILADYELAQIADYDLDAVVDGTYLVHASPFEPDHWHYLLTPAEVEKGFDYLKHDFGFCGHTHLPMIFSQSGSGQIRSQVGHDFDPNEEARYLINVGSVGQPRDNDPRASYVLFDSEAPAVTFHRVEYDVKTAQAKMADVNMPRELISRLDAGR